jgi:glycosyltransferase involved in cell wall biosynthesis
VLDVAAAVVATSAWTRDRLREWYALPADRVYVAHPGADPAGTVRAATDGTELLCVAAVAPHKGHDVLVDALAATADVHWRCRFVGPLDRDPAFVARLHDRLTAHGLADRTEFAGPRVGADLDSCFTGADLLVSASLGETYGMALTDALARGLPVVTTDVGGVREALGGEPERLPGLLIPPADSAALATALRRWLTEPDLRAQLRAAAAARRETLPSWRASADAVAGALVAAASAAR